MPTTIVRRALNVILLGAVGLLVGCSLWSPRPELPSLPLLPVSELGGEIQVSQRVKVTRDGQSQTFMAAWAVNKGELTMVGLTPTGQRLLTLRYDGQTFSADYSDLLTDPIPGRDVLTHLQFAHWPAASLRRALLDSPWSIRFRNGRRELYLDEQLILTIERIAGGPAVSGGLAIPAGVHIDSPAMAYRLEVKTLE